MLYGQENGVMKPDIPTIKEIATDVYRTLGSGFAETIYDHAMQVGLRLRGSGTKARKRSNSNTVTTTWVRVTQTSSYTLEGGRSW
jgi:hypothetical protein